MYLTILAILILMALIEIKYKDRKSVNILKYIAVGMLVILVCFRFNIQDYWGYFQNYYSYDNFNAVILSERVRPDILQP